MASEPYFAPVQGGTTVAAREICINKFEEGVAAFRSLIADSRRCQALATEGKEWKTVEPGRRLVKGEERRRKRSRSEERHHDGERSRKRHLSLPAGESSRGCSSHDHDDRDRRYRESSKGRSSYVHDDRDRCRERFDRDRDCAWQGLHRDEDKDRGGGGRSGEGGKAEREPSSQGQSRRPEYRQELTEEEKRHRDGFGSNRALFDRRKFERAFKHEDLLATLPPHEQEVYCDNPHIRQVFVNRYKFERAGAPMLTTDRVLTDDKGRTPYARRSGEAKTVEHWGQRKLLLSEIEFLTLHGSRPDSTVVYAGAAPGTHTNFLAAALFPDLRFVLVDPANFHAWETDRLRIVNECFTTELAHQFRQQQQNREEEKIEGQEKGEEGQQQQQQGKEDGQGGDEEEQQQKQPPPEGGAGAAGALLFVSDIRSTQQGMSSEEFEERVSLDMKVQEEWTRVLQPTAAMLKFRLPYDVKRFPTVEYLDGQIYLPIWGPRTTTETRLIATDPKSRKLWDCLDYESALFHFNTVTRTRYFEHDQKAEGYDHCYDCAGEALVLGDYLSRRHGITHPEVLTLAVDRLSELLSTHIGSTRKSLKVSGIDKL